MVFADGVGRRLAIGWTMGTLVSALGVYFSVLLDLPTGAAIVCTFGAVLVVMFFIHLLFFHGGRAQAQAVADSLENPHERVLESERCTTRKQIRPNAPPSVPPVCYSGN